jgi:hypothetical protein
VGKPNEREKDLLFSFRKVYYSSKLTISSQGKIPHSTNKQSQKFCLEKRAQVRTAVWPPPNLCLRKHAQQGTVRPAQYGPAAARKTQKMPRFPCQTAASKTVPFFLLYGLYGSVQYGPATEKWNNTANKKSPWDLCPLSPWEMCPLKLLTFLSQAYSEKSL